MANDVWLLGAAFAVGVLTFFPLWIQSRKIKEESPLSDAMTANQLLVSQLSLSRREMRDMREEWQTERAELKLEVSILTQWVRMLSVQIVELGGKPVSEADARRATLDAKSDSPGVPPKPIDAARLAQIMARAFSLSEMQSMAFGLGVDWESIPGTTAQRKADELVDYMRRIGRLSELDAAVRKARPKEFE